MATETQLVRPATTADAAALSRLMAIVQRLHAETEPEWFLLPEGDLFAPEFVREKLADPTHQFFVAEVDGQVAGYVMTVEQRRPTTPFSPALFHLSIDQICVHPDFRRRGLARALLGRSRQQARELGVTGIQLGIWQFNEASRAFFMGEGFLPKHTRYFQAMP